VRRTQDKVLLVLFVVVGFVETAVPQNDLPVAPIEAIQLYGLTNVYLLRNPRMEVAVFPAAGRFAVTRFGDGEGVHRLETNLLAKAGSPSADWVNIGGDWLWPVAQSRWAKAFGREWPPPPCVDGSPWEAAAWVCADNRLECTLRRKVGDPLNIDIARTLVLDSKEALLTIRQRIQRTAASDIPVTLWGISQFDRPEDIVMPVDDSGRDGALHRLGFDPLPSNIVFACSASRVLRVSEGTEHKVGSSSARTWIAGRRSRVLLLVRSQQDDPSPRFPDSGCGVELYANRGLGYAELETFGSEKPLQPGESIANVVTLECHLLPAELAACELSEEVRHRVGEIPPPASAGSASSPPATP
jgi:hypothetical protein